ncbi:hypothetical protein [Bacillus testis]|uniref:hypothetical protein n=1 Tax=Bacillus testis TaxID=1622072 RepID=UPI00067EF38E|nr:hypothetical protein [Bacillus testis]
MKRYLFTVLAAIVPIAALLVYYIQEHAERKEYSQIALERVSGDQELAKDVRLKGNLTINRSNHMVEVDDKGSNIQPITAFKRAFGVWDGDGNGKMEERIRKYPSFMREKRDESAFDETGKWLLYAHPIDMEKSKQLHVSILDKDSMKEKQVFIQLPSGLSKQKQANIAYMETEGNILRLLIRSSDSKDWNLYRLTIDLNSSQVKESTRLFNDRKRAGQLTRELDTTPSSYYGEKTDPESIFFSWTEEQRTEVDDELTQVEVKGRSILRVNMGSGQVEQMIRLTGTEAENHVEYSERYLIYQDKKSFGLVFFDTATKQIKKVPGLLNTNSISPIVKDGKIYAVSTSMDNKKTTLSIIDIASGSELYMGQIVLPYNMDIFIHEMQIR